MVVKGLLFSEVTLIVRDILGCASSPTTFALLSRHTRLRQLTDYLRSRFEMALRGFW